MSAVQVQSWFSDLGQRLRWAWTAFRAPSVEPVVYLADGVQLDLVNRRIFVPGELHIHSGGTMRFTSDSHVILRSGVENGGCIWFNTREDEFGNPIREPEPAPQLEHHHDHG
jgi:hypothetical protein